MSENRNSVDGKRITNPSAGDLTRQEPGDFAWEFDFTHFEHGAREMDEIQILYICLPGNEQWAPIRVKRGESPGDRIWGWDGNLDKPTIKPSIWEKGIWHGHMIAGRLISA